MDIFITLSFDAVDEKRLLSYAERYNMTVQKNRKAKTFKVFCAAEDAIYFYYLGANLAQPPFETGITKHI
jgi:hypothetical protein